MKKSERSQIDSGVSASTIRLEDTERSSTIFSCDLTRAFQRARSDLRILKATTTTTPARSAVVSASTIRLEDTESFCNLGPWSVSTTFQRARSDLRILKVSATWGRGLFRRQPVSASTIRLEDTERKKDGQVARLTIKFQRARSDLRILKVNTLYFPTTK